MTDAIKDGVWNLVANCAEAAPGETVLVLNRRGATDPRIAALVEDAVLARGADCHALWSAPPEADATALPKVLTAALLAADKAIFNCPMNRVILDRYTRGSGVTQIHNRYVTEAAMRAEDARYHWSLVVAICRRLEELTAGARRWRIESAAGTDVSGEIGRPTEIAGAYFAQEIEGLRNIRVFPGEVYSPVGSVAAAGRIVSEYINNLDSHPWDHPAILTVEDNRVVEVSGEGGSAERFGAMIADTRAAHGDVAHVVDSWHGGMNPMARRPTDADRLLKGAATSPALMHFHIGRQLDPISAGVMFPTVEIDGVPFIENGEPRFLEDPELKAAAQAVGC